MTRLAIVAAVLGVSVGSDAQRAPAPRGVHVMRTASSPFVATATPHLDYYGGHVIPNAKVYQVNWTSASQVDMSGFFTGVTNSNFVDWLNEYNTNITPTAGPSSTGTNQSIGRGVFAGTYTITPSSANAGGTAACSGSKVTNCCLSDVGTPPSGTKCIQDSQVTDELAKQIAAGHLPPFDENALYFVFFPANILVGQGIGTSGAGSSCIAFCGYHGTYSDSGSGASVYYAVMPSEAAGSGCDQGCGSTTASTGAATRMQEVSSHELIEAITDAEVGVAANFAAPLGWYWLQDQSNQGEIADICNPPYQAATAFTTVGSFHVQTVWSNTKNACVASRTATNDFNVSLSPNTKSVAAGNSSTVTVNAGNFGTAQSLTLSANNVPDGVTATFDHTTINSGGSATLTLTAASGAALVSDQVVQIVAAGSSITHTAGLLLAVTAPVVGANDFSLQVTPGSQLIEAGSSADYTVTGTLVSGSSETVTLTVGTLPSGIHASWASSGTATGSLDADGGTDTLTLSVDTPHADLSQTSFNIKGTSTSVPTGHTISATVGVGTPAANDFSLDVTPSSRTLFAINGATVSYTVSTAVTSGVGEDVVFSIDSTPTGVTASFSPTHVTAGGSSTLTLTAGAGATSTGGAFNFNVTGTATSSQQSAAADVTVTSNNFSLSISPSSAQTMASNATRTFTVTASAGTAANIDLTVSGLPAGVTGAFDTTPIAPGGTSTLTLTSTSAPASSATVFTVTGTDDEGLVRTTTGSIQVVASDFSISLSSSNISLARGAQTSVSVTTSAIGTAPTVSFSASGLPSGVTASFSPTSATAGGGSTLTLAASSTALITSGATLTVIGTAGGVTHNAFATLAVTGTPGTPTVSITHPANGDTVSGAVEIDFSATAAAGSSLLRVDVMIDGTVIGNATSSPGQVFWTSAQQGDGSHVITAKAIDQDTGNATSDAVTVTVNNAGGGSPGGGGSGGCSTTGGSMGGLALLGLFALRRRKR